MSSRVAILLLLGAALATGGCDRKSAAPEQANVTQANVATADEVTSDEAPATTSAPAAGKVDRTHKGEPALAAAFEAPDGKPVTLAAFRGKPLLLNLWATWCAPCVAEMPTLDAAAVKLGNKATVLVVSQDLQGKSKVAPFFAARNFTALKPYTDPQIGLSLGYGANLPTTFLFDAQGKEIWRVTGGMNWTGPEATALIAEAG